MRMTDECLCEIDYQVYCGKPMGHGGEHEEQVMVYAAERDTLLREHHQAKAGERKWQVSFDQLAEKHMRQTDDVERLKRELRSAEDAEKTLREIFDTVQQQRDGAQADAAASRRIITGLQAALARHVRP